MSRRTSTRSYVRAATVPLFTLLLSTWTMATRAQVNVESLRKSVAANGIGGKLNTSIATYRGNTNGIELGASGLVGGGNKRHLAYLNASGRYSHVGSKVTVARAFSHARYNYRLIPLLALEVLGQLEKDRAPRIALRTLLGAGVRSTLSEDKQFAAYWGGTYLFEHNQLLRDHIAVRPATVHRFSSYLTAVTTLPNAGAILSSTLYCQPRLGDLEDIRLLWEASLSFDLAPYLTAGIHAKYRYETPVIAGVKSGDLTVLNTIGLKL